MRISTTENVTPFQFHDTTIAVMNRNGQPWFVAADVCRVLELTNTSKACDTLEDDEKGVTNGDTLGGKQQLLIISESGLYSLIFKSRKPEAKAFRKWVTSEVLPSIRKTGGYGLPTNFAEALRALANEAEETERLRVTVQQQAPAVEFVERYVEASGLFGIREAAQIIGLPQREFVNLCMSRRILHREGESQALQPYAEWLAKGYFEVKTGEAGDHAFKQTKLTSKGLEWVRRRIATAPALTLVA